MDTPSDMLRLPVMVRSRADMREAHDFCRLASAPWFRFSMEILITYNISSKRDLAAANVNGYIISVSAFRDSSGHLASLRQGAPPLSALHAQCCYQGKLLGFLLPHSHCLGYVSLLVELGSKSSIAGSCPYTTPSFCNYQQ